MQRLWTVVFYITKKTLWCGLLVLLLLFPEIRDFFLRAQTDIALVAITHSLLGPEWAFILEVYLYCSEKRC